MSNFVLEVSHLFQIETELSEWDLHIEFSTPWPLESSKYLLTGFCFYFFFFSYHISKTVLKTLWLEVNELNYWLST